jgi:hypothetical protein
MACGVLRPESLRHCVNIRLTTERRNSRTGEKYNLFYIRNKEKKETDFLVLRNKNPWLLVEAKLSDTAIEKHHTDASAALGGIPVVQVCLEPGIMVQQSKASFRVSASRFFG